MKKRWINSHVGSQMRSLCVIGKGFLEFFLGKSGSILLLGSVFPISYRGLNGVSSLMRHTFVHHSDQVACLLQD